MSTQPLLEVKNLKKYFKTPRGMLHAVDDVTFTLESLRRAARSCVFWNPPPARFSLRDRTL